MANQQIERYKEERPVKMYAVTIQANLRSVKNEHLTFVALYHIGDVERVLQRLQLDGTFDINGLEGYIAQDLNTISVVRERLKQNEDDFANTGRVARVVYEDAYINARRRTVLDWDEFLKLGCPITISVQEKEEVRASNS